MVLFGLDESFEIVEELDSNNKIQKLENFNFIFVYDLPDHYNKHYIIINIKK